MTVKCQNANIITAKEYDNIKINTTRLIDIKKTKGFGSKVISCFSAPKNIVKDLDADGYVISIDYFFENLEISFYEEELSNIDITGNKSSINIKGVTITIGDHINKLGNVIFNTQKDNSKSIIYTACEGCNNYFVIECNQVTKEITKIYYIEMT